MIRGHLIVAINVKHNFTLRNVCVTGKTLKSGDLLVLNGCCRHKATNTGLFLQEPEPEYVNVEGARNRLQGTVPPAYVAWRN